MCANLGGTAGDPVPLWTVFLFAAVSRRHQLADRGGGISVSDQVRIRLPNGDELSMPRGVTPAQVAEAIGPGLARAALVAEVDGALVDLSHPIQNDVSLRILTAEDPEGLETLRHSTAHLMAQALQRLHPGTKLAIGPPIEDGFYYDVDCPKQLTPEDLERIEEEMRAIVKEDLAIQREE